jgi:general secretion pathway protein M
MNTATMSPLGARWRALVTPLRQRWQALSARDRRIASTLAWALGLVLLWFIAVVPAWRSVTTAPARLDAIDKQLQQMQRLAAETATLRALPPVGGLQSQSALKAATDALGPAARLVLGGDRATITFTNASGTQVRDWLAEVRSAARVRPVEANLTRGPQGYSGNVIVQMPGANG